MINRLTDIAIVVLWLATTSWLVMRDLLPNYLASDPPGTGQVLRQGPRQYKSGIYDSTGRRIGVSYISIRPSADNLRVSCRTELRHPIFDAVGLLTVNTTLLYGHDDALERLDLVVFGLPVHVSVTVENFGMDFSAELIVGSYNKHMIFDSQSAQHLSQMLQPFFFLPDLYVGRCWRIWTFNPLSPATFKPVLITVVCKETIKHRGVDISVFRIEGAQGLVAWADDAGRVIRQQLELPMLGTFTIIDEPVDKIRAPLQITKSTSQKVNP